MLTFDQVQELLNGSNKPKSSYFIDDAGRRTYVTTVTPEMAGYYVGRKGKKRVYCNNDVVVAYKV